MMNKKNNNKLILVSLFLVLLLGTGVYFAFMKKSDSSTIDNTKNNVPQTDNGGTNTDDNKIDENEPISIIKNAESHVGIVHLDSNGNIYFELSIDPNRSEGAVSTKLKELKQKQKNYKSDDFESGKFSAIRLISSIKDIDYIEDGQAGYGYYTMISNDGKLYLIEDAKIEQEGTFELLELTEVSDVTSVSSEVKDDGVSAYAVTKNGTKVVLANAIKSGSSSVISYK